MTQSDIVAAARTWIGTPYRHQASKRLMGADCLGLLRGVWRECMGEEPEPVPAYTPDWSEQVGSDRLLLAMRRHFEEVLSSAARPGDVLLFRMRAGATIKHCAILSAPGKIIHAYWGRGVTETQLVPWWERRVAAAFRFPKIME